MGSRQFCRSWWCRFDAFVSVLTIFVFTTLYFDLNFFLEAEEYIEMPLLITRFGLQPLRLIQTAHIVRKARQLQITQNSTRIYWEAVPHSDDVNFATSQSMETGGKHQYLHDGRSHQHGGMLLEPALVGRRTGHQHHTHHQTGSYFLDPYAGAGRSGTGSVELQEVVRIDVCERSPPVARISGPSAASSATGTPNWLSKPGDHLFGPGVDSSGSSGAPNSPNDQGLLVASTGQGAPILHDVDPVTIPVDDSEHCSFRAYLPAIIEHLPLSLRWDLLVFREQHCHW